MSFFNLRLAKPTDLNFILGTFRDSMRDDSQLAKSCKTSVFKREFTKVIDSILARSKVTIACTKEDQSVILGYAITEDPGILHYLFVKEPFRRKGIANYLVNHLFKPRIVECSLKTNLVKRILDNKTEFIYNPFLLYRQELGNGNKS